MFEFFKRLVLRIAKVPAEPHPPAGSPGSIKTFRAATNYWKYLLVLWGIKQVFGAIAIFFFLSLSAAWLASTENAGPPANQPVRARPSAPATPTAPAPAPTPAPSAPAGDTAATAPPQDDSKIPEGRRKRRKGQSGRTIARETQRKVSWWIHTIDLVGLGIFFLQLPFSLAKTRLDYELRWYMVTDRSMRLREGIYSVREMTLTFANVQNISIRQGPLQRYLGISDVVVQTAGGGASAHSHEGGGESASMHTGVLRAVDNAEHVRDLILDRLKRMRDSGLGDPDDRHHAHHDPTEDLLTAVQELLTAARALR